MHSFEAFVVIEDFATPLSLVSIPPQPLFSGSMNPVHLPALDCPAALLLPLPAPGAHPL